MSRSVMELLTEALKGLSEEQFRTFTHKLANRTEEPRVQRRDLLGIDRGDVASLLVDTFTEQRALTVTEDVLKSIGCNQTRLDLQPAVATACSTSWTRLTPNSEANFIDNNWTELVQRATGMEAILDRLLREKVINNDQYSEINAESTPQRKMRALNTGPINSSGALGKCVLYDILMEQQPYMMMDLGSWDI